jgi:hypothetical protein
LVVATGPFQTPRTPAFAAAVGPAVHQLHSADYLEMVVAMIAGMVVLGLPVEAPRASWAPAANALQDSAPAIALLGMPPS